ncbi:DUF2933 domain-containing protein [Caballeronia sp. LjRoot34]|uniref:DUF2933 domain-containing protein n=1 Tax=Caballeronia sp. LjRoot34 TaxID=3342325 RepID=UPI003ECDF225
MERGNRYRKAGTFFVSRANLVLIGFLAIGGFYLVTEHRAHLYGWWPFLFILACPLMHLFMHHGHGGHDDSEHLSDPASARPENTPPHQH